MPNELNPDNRACVQMLLDMAASSHIMPDMRVQVLGLAKQLSGAYSGLAAETDKRFAQHQYPEKALDWGRMTLYDKSIAGMWTLKPAARSILVLMMQTAKHRCLVSIPKRTLMQVLDIQWKHTAQEAVQELLDGHWIAVYKPQAGHNAPVYMVWPGLICCGTDNQTALIDAYKKLTGGYEPVPDETYSAALIKTGSGADTLLYNTIVPADTAKPPAGNKKTAPVPAHTKAAAPLVDTARDIPDDMQNLPFAR